MRVAIAGGGIAGLSAAIALSARGIEADIFERAPRLEEVGAGIQLSPNATVLLERMGVTRNLAGKASEPDALAILDGRSGDLLTRMPLGATARARYGAAYLTLQRADLQSALVRSAEACANVALHLDARVGDVRETGDGVTFTAGGAQRRADLLIAADGVHSSVRQQVFGDPAPAALGRTAWRALIPASAVAGADSRIGEIGLWFGSAGHLVHYPVAGGEGLNIVVIGKGATEDPPPTPFGSRARGIIAAANGWSSSALFHLPPRPVWGGGRVVLIGDAAHAMAPSAAQGGAASIEDAWVLADRLAEKKDISAGFASFASMRGPRVERIAAASLCNLHVYEMTGPAAFARNTVLRALPAILLLTRLDWLYAWKPE